MQAKQRLQQLRAARAHEAEDSEHFAAAQVKGNVPHGKVPGALRMIEVQAFDAQHFVTGLGPGAREHLGQVAADHHPHDVVMRRSLCLLRADVTAVAHHRELVRDDRQFIELVRDVDDRHAVGLELVNEPVQHLHLLIGDRRSRLVHDDDARLERERLGDLHDLLLPDPQGRHLPPRVHIQLEAAQPFRGLAIHARIVDQSGARERLASEENILRDREVRDEIQLLKNDRDAGFARVAGIAK